MKSYNTEWIRNVGIVGHGDTGKTQLVSSLLFTAGMTPRLGKVRRRLHGHRLGRRGNRAQDHRSTRAWPTPNGRRRAQPEKTKDQSAGYARLLDIHQRNEIVADCRRRGADRGGRRGRRAGGHRKSVGLRHRIRSAARVRAELDGPRAGELRPRDGIARSTCSDAAWCRCNCRSARRKDFRGVVDLITMKALIYTPDGDGKAKIEEIPAGAGRSRQRRRTKRWWKWWPRATTR